MAKTYHVSYIKLVGNEFVVTEVDTPDDVSDLAIKQAAGDIANLKVVFGQECTLEPCEVVTKYAIIGDEGY